jgi:SpoVK/Ycf46/Vps4 family AAA+-type ATPase
MANSDQIKALIKSHFDKDGNRFKTIALQLAASEARNGHGNLANDIKKLIESGSKTLIRKIPNKKNLSDLMQWVEPETRLSQLVASDELKNRIERILKEYKQKSKLSKYGMTNRRKVLLAGPPGTGKTFTASIIANELDLPIYVILIDKIVTKYMGETAAKLRMVFDFIESNKGVYLFDEFDAIGTERARDNEVGEMRRVLNAFLQFLEQDQSNSFILAATNNIGLLDTALFRRFDDTLFYNLPSKEEAFELIKNKLINFKYGFKIENISLDSFVGLSHAEISLACEDAVKDMILSGKKQVQKKAFISMLQNRQEIYKRK